jgi:hypothetical protein
MEICLGMMLMRPVDFWNLSPQELYAALRGFKKFHSTSESNEPISRSKLEEMMELNPDEL